MINGISRQINTTVAKIKKNRTIGPSNVSKEIWALLDEADKVFSNIFEQEEEISSFSLKEKKM